MLTAHSRPGPTSSTPTETRRRRFGGTFVIEGSGWTSVQPGALKDMGEDGPAVRSWSSRSTRCGHRCVMPAAPQWPPGRRRRTWPTSSPPLDSRSGRRWHRSMLLAITGYHLVDRGASRMLRWRYPLVWAGPNFGRALLPGQPARWWSTGSSMWRAPRSWSKRAGSPARPEEDVAELQAVLDTLVITP